MSLNKLLVYLVCTVSLTISCCVVANVVPSSDVAVGAAAAASSSSSSLSGDGPAIIKTENTVSTTNPSSTEENIMQLLNTQPPTPVKSLEQEVTSSHAAPTAAAATPAPSTVAPTTSAPVTTSPSTPITTTTPAPPVPLPVSTTVTTVPAAMAAAKREEAALINEVVSKVLESDPKSIDKNTTINVFDVSNKQQSQLNTPKAGNVSSVPTVKGLLNDPNTLLVLVDDSKSNSTSVPPSAAPVLANTTTVSPALVYNKTSTADLVNSIINDPKNDNKNISVTVEVIKTPTTVMSVLNPTKTASLNTTTVKLIKNSNSTTPTKNVTSTTTLAPTKMSVTTLKPVSTSAPSTTKKAKESLAELLRRHEKERKELEMKLKGDTTLKQRKQNEKDAHMALKTLQAARGHSTDNKLHQLEHNRQMALDPIGHTLKHQQYELSKQRLLSGV